MLGIAASEPIAAVGHPPAKDADGNGGQQRPQDGQREVRNQPERNKGSPEDLALHFLILPPAEALSPSENESVSMKTTCQVLNSTAFHTRLTECGAWTGSRATVAGISENSGGVSTKIKGGMRRPIGYPAGS